MKPILGALVLAIVLLAGAASGAEPPAGYTDALRWYLRAAEAGDANAQFLLGRMFESGVNRKRDLAAAAMWYRKAAEQGHRLAQFALGLMYYAGRGVKQDYANAAGWYEKAAAQGLPEAQFNLACLYDRGLGVARDTGKARAWYEKAARQGLTPAQLNLGLLLAGRGNAVPSGDDLVAAYYWLGRAAQKDVASAAAARDDIASRLSPALLARARGRLASGESKPMKPVPLKRRR